MIDPLKEPVLSLLLSEKCKVEVLPLLQALPLNDINRFLSFSSRHSPRLHKDTQTSVLESFLVLNQSFRDDDKDHPIKEQIAVELVNQGASLSNTGFWENGKSQWDILDLAFNHGHYKFVQYLLEGPLQHLTSSLNGRETHDGFTWLQNAVRLNDVDFAKKLLLWGVDCNAICSTNRTALFYTTSAEMLLVLLEAGARVDVVETDKHGRSLSDHWNKTLTAVEVKKLNSALFKSLKKTGSLDTHAMHSSWVDSLLNSSKGVMSDQQKKLKIPSNFTWEKDGLKCSPFTWIAINNNTYRSSFQQKKIMLHFVGDPQNMEMGVCEGLSISNLDVLAFLEATLDSQHKQRIGWPNNHLWLEKWANEHSNLDLGDRIEKMCTTFTYVAVLLQSAPWVSQPVKHTAFDWYKKMFSGRESAIEPYYKSSLLALGRDIATMYSISNYDAHTGFAKALQTAWEQPITKKLKEYAFLHPQFDSTSFLCMYDLMDSDMDDTNIKNIVRAFAHETVRILSYFSRKIMYSPVTDTHANEFNAMVDKALDTLDVTGCGILFEDDEWNRLSKVYQDASRISSADINYEKWERVKSLMERETINRHLDASSTPSSKRKM